MIKKFPKGGAHKNLHEFLDADYLHKLTKAEREWYDNFIKAEYMADHPSAKTIKGKELTKKEKKRLNAQNNRRVRDAHNHLDRRTTADSVLNKTEVENDRGKES